jgi:hypothetical protein
MNWGLIVQEHEVKAFSIISVDFITRSFLFFFLVYFFFFFFKVVDYGTLYVTMVGYILKLRKRRG